MTDLIVREPIKLQGQEWSDAVEMLCMMCAHFSHCDICEEMIERKHEPEPVKNGFATDPGSEYTCLSYKPKKHPELSEDHLQRLIAESEGKEMCNGCAARKGSDASMSLHTNRDFQHCVNSKALFTCHEEGRRGTPCVGWCNAVKTQ